MKLIASIHFLKDRARYGSCSGALFWYQKYKGRDWFKGQNFGDYLSYVVVGEMLRRRKLKFSNSSKRMLAIGSVIHFACNNDVIWGSGVNGKMPLHSHKYNKLDVRAVRGPLTGEFLQKKGIGFNNVFGDPALLLPHLFPALKPRPQKGKIILLPNLNELETCMQNCPEHMQLVSPLGHWKNIVGAILSSELVLTSSLHGLLVSEIYGIPARFVLPSGGETLFKYEDYYLGTGRTLVPPSETFKDPIHEDMGRASQPFQFNPAPLMEAFPYDLFVK